MPGKNKSNNQDLPCVCEFCEHATTINDEFNVLCNHRGIVNKEYKCKKFVYDPLKRVPRPLPPLPKLTEEDLVL